MSFLRSHHPEFASSSPHLLLGAGSFRKPVGVLCIYPSETLQLYQSTLKVDDLSLRQIDDLALTNSLMTGVMTVASTKLK